MESFEIALSVCVSHEPSFYFDKIFIEKFSIRILDWTNDNGRALAIGRVEWKLSETFPITH